MSDPKLTDKQQAFIRFYTESRNGTQAARLAGYRGSENTLKSIANENLSKPHIAEKIGEIDYQALDGAEITVEGVLRDLVRLKEKAEESGQLATAVKATELHGKYLKMWVDRIEHMQSMENISTEKLTALLTRLIEQGNVDLSSIINVDGPQNRDISSSARTRKTH